KNVTTILIEREPESGQRLLSLTMRGLDGKKIDIVGLVNLRDVKIFMRRDRSGLYESKVLFHGEVIFCPFPDDQIDLATLLHELGHAEQSTDGEIKIVSKLYFLGSPKSELDYKQFLEDLKKINFFSSECERLEIQINELLLLKKELHTLEVRGFKKLLNKDEGGAKTDADNRQMALKIVELRVKIRDIEDKLQIDELLELLRVIRENDATTRALSWMSTIEKAGINVLAPQKASREDIENDRKEVNDPYSDLREALLSYCIGGSKRLKKLERK
ncbi:MAG: hypothetical protein WA057_00950, partial [Candidatus Magasanikiibacteriota bacterium]